MRWWLSSVRCGCGKRRLWHLGRVGFTMFSVLPEDLTESERLLVGAFRRGAWVDFRTGDLDVDSPEHGSQWTEERVIRAEVVSALLLGATGPEPGNSPALRLRGARIVGRVDLMSATIAYPLVCEYCHFEQELRFVEAATRTVRLVSCWLAAFNGARMRAEGIVNFHTTTIEGTLRLERAKVVGEVCVRRVSVGRQGVEVALAADGLVVEGPMECSDGFTAHGAVHLRGARIGGRLDLREAVLDNPGGRALRAGNLVVEGPLDATRLEAAGEVRLMNSRIAGWMSLRGATLRNPGGRALSAGGIVLGGGLWGHQGLSAEGEVRLIGSRLGGNLNLTGAVLSHPDGIALNLDRSALTDVDATEIKVAAGTLSFANAQITGQVGLADARLNGGADRLALAGDGAVIGGALQLSRLRAQGGLSLRTCRVGGRVHLIGAVLENPGGIALRMSRGEIAADMFCGGMTAVGSLKLSGARIANHLQLNDVLLSDPDVAFNAETLQAATVTLRPRAPIEGLVTFKLAHIGRLRDDPSCWPRQLTLDGFTYGSLEPRLPARDRLRWLARDPDSHRSQPYEQLASSYAAIGQSVQARRVLHAKERRERAAKSPLGRAWGVVQDVTVAYGYQPWRAVLWLIALLASGSVIFALHAPPPLVAGQAPHFNPVIYTLDLLVPIVDLGQKHAFNPAGAQQWFSYLLVAAGWILATTVARAAARTLGRG